MSGIFGIFHRDGRPVLGDDLDQMSSSLAHRAVDGSNLWNRGSVGFGHNMLMTTPEAENEKLPYEEVENNLVITADARIDNRAELFSSLSLGSLQNDAVSDSYLIIQSYKKWGADCIHHLLGDFVFAIWDGGRNNLFCARDHMGVKPFYYFLSNKQFVFASEPQAIVALSSVDKELNEERIADFLVSQLEGIDLVSTFYKNVFRLPPAKRLIVTPEKCTESTYWQLDRSTELQLKSDGDYIDGFKDILNNSIQARLRCYNRPAATLSGGIDSATIVAFAQKLLKNTSAESLAVYSGISDRTDGCIESEQIKQVLEHTGISGRRVKPSEVCLHAEEILQVLGQMVEPYDMSMVLVAALYQNARKDGCRVVLDGIDGDIVASLPPSYPTLLFRNGQVAKAFTETFKQSRNYYNGKYSAAKLFYKYGRMVLSPQLLREIFRPASLTRQTRRVVAETLINSQFAQKVQLQQRLKQLNSHGIQRDSLSMRDIHITTINHPYLTVALERYDRVAACCGIEPRHPLLDKRMVEFCVALPWQYLVCEGCSKVLLRRAAAGYLPEGVCGRHGFEHLGWSFTRSLVPGIKKEIKKNREHLRRFVNVDLLLRMVATEKRMEKPAVQLNVWEAYSLAIWLNKIFPSGKKSDIV